MEPNGFGKPSGDLENQVGGVALASAEPETDPTWSQTHLFMNTMYSQ